MPIGRPVSLTPNVKSKNISVIATSGQTSFTVGGGYRINNITVYRNGSRLSHGKDFTASDGSVVTLINPATLGDVIAYEIFDSFAPLVDVIQGNGNQSINGDLTITGTYTGDGSGLTGVANTDVVHTREVTVSGMATFAQDMSVGAALTVTGNLAVGGDLDITGDISYDEVTGRNLNITGIATIHTLGVTSTTTTNDLSVGAATTIAGITKITNVTSSTSSTTGALIVTGGIGVGGSVFLGDSKGVTFGAGKDLEILHDATAGDSYIIDRGTGDLKLDASAIVLQHAQSKKFETTPTGALVTGIATVTTKLVAAGLSYPTSDGSEGQIVETDGSGTLSFVDKPSGGGGGDWLTNSLF